LAQDAVSVVDGPSDHSIAPDTLSSDATAAPDASAGDASWAQDAVGSPDSADDHAVGSDTAANDGADVALDVSGASLDGTQGATDDAQAAGDAGTPGAGCVAIPSSALHVSASAASGTVIGNNLNALLCPGGASAYVESAGARYDTVPYFLLIEWTLGAGPANDFDFRSPAGANNGELSVMVGLNSAGPGSYTSPAGQECGSLAFTYYLPVPAGVDCAGRSGPNCPPGCGAVCSSLACTACTAQAPSVSYTAQGATDCMGNSQTPIGSWRLSLTSVAPGATGTGSSLSYFTPHGSFDATMMAADGSADTATLSVTF
jgi:hypothetical protein